LVELDLAQRRARQRLPADHEVGEPLVRRQLARPLLDGGADRLLPIAFTGAGHDHGDELALLLEHAHVADRWAGLVRLLDLIELGLLPTLGDDQRLDPASDVQEAVRVEMTKVAGAEPTVMGEGLGSFLGQVVIALKDAWPAGEDFALFQRGARSAERR